MPSNNPQINASEVQWDTPSIDTSEIVWDTEKETPDKKKVLSATAEAGSTESESQLKPPTTVSSTPTTGGEKNTEGGLETASGKIIQVPQITGVMDDINARVPVKNTSQGQIYTPDEKKVAEEKLFNSFTDTGAYQVGYEKLNQGDLGSAEKMFALSAQKNPKNAKALEGLAYVNQQKGNYQNALDYYRQAQALDPQNVNIANGIAFNALKVGDTEEAKRNNDAVLSSDPTNPNALGTKSLIQEREGDKEGASLTLDEALKQNTLQSISPKINELAEEYFSDPNSQKFRDQINLFAGTPIESAAATGFEGAKNIGEGLKRMFTATGYKGIGGTGNEREALNGALQFIQGGSELAFAAGMSTPHGLAFVAAMHPADVISNGYASKILMSPITSFTPQSQSETVQRLKALGDIGISLIGITLAHKALKGNKNIKAEDALTKLKEGKDLTGDEIQTLYAETNESYTPENIKKLQSALDDIPMDAPNQSDLAGQLASLTEQYKAIEKKQEGKIEPIVEKLETEKQQVADEIKYILDSSQKTEPIELPVEPSPLTPKSEEDLLGKPIPQTGKGEGDWSRDVESTAKALEGVELPDNFVSQDKGGILNRENYYRLAQEKFQESEGLTTEEIFDKNKQREEFKTQKGRDAFQKKFEQFAENPINKKQIISEAYHKAKADGSNPELVKAVEDLLGKPTQPKSEGNNVDETQPTVTTPSTVLSRGDVEGGRVSELLDASLKKYNSSNPKQKEALKQKVEENNKHLEGLIADLKGEDVSITNEKGELVNTSQSLKEQLEAGKQFLKEISTSDEKGAVKESPSTAAPAKSIIGENVDLKGGKKDAWMFTPQEHVKLIFGKLYTGKEKPTQEVIDHAKQFVQKAIDAGNVESAIKEVRISPQDAIKIIESVGLKVPKGISAPSLSSNTPSKTVVVDEKVVKSRVKRISKSLNVDEQRSQQIHDIALKAKDYEDFKKQVGELIGDDTVNENRIAEQYDDIRNEAKSEYEKELERNLEDLRAAYTDATLADAALKMMNEKSPKSVRGFIKRLLTGATPESVAANKARLVEMQRQYRKEKADMRAMLPRERGANFVVEKLSRAARNGDISQEAADLAIDLIRKQPDMFGDLAISITGKKGESDGVQGWYRAADALVKIFKNPSDETTVAHEVLHHTERFLPHEIRDKIIAEWNNEVNLQIADIQKKLKNETNVDKRQQLTQGLLFLGMAQERQIEPNHANQQAMEAIMSKYLGDHTDSKGNFHKGLGNSWYQLYNPSEWWAVNASRLFREAKNKPELKTWVDKAKAFYDYLIESVKKIFKGSPTEAVEKGLKAILKGETLEDREGKMLSASQKLLNIKQKGSYEDRLKSIYDEVQKNKKPQSSKPVEQSKSPEPKVEGSNTLSEVETKKGTVGESEQKPLTEQSPKTKLQLAKERFAEAKKKADDAYRTSAIDPFEQKKRQAQADRELFDAYLDVAREYISETANKAFHTLKDFAKELGEDVNDKIEKAWNVATGKQKYDDAVKEFEAVSGKEELPNQPFSSAQKETEILREQLGIEPYERTPETLEQWNSEANQRIANGEMPQILDKMRSGEIPDDVEKVMLNKYINSLNEKVKTDPSDAILKQLKEAIQLNDKQNTEWGRLGRAIQERNDPIQTLGEAYVAKMEANGVDTLTDAQKAEVKAQFDKVNELKDKAEAKVRELEEKVAQLEAEKEVNKQKSKTTKTKKSHADYVAERKEIVGSIKEKLRKARGEMQATVIPYANELIAISPDVAKLMKSYIGEGIDKLTDLVAKIHADLKEDIPSITERDVRDIIAGKYNERKETKNELQAKLKDIRDEQKLIDKLEALNRGELPKTEREKIKRNQQISDLQKQIKEHDLTKLSEYKKRQLQAAAKLRERIEKGDFEPEKPKSVIESVEAKNRFPKEYNEALDALIEHEDARADFDIALLRDQKSKQGKLDKVLDIGKGIVATGKALKAGIDDSAIFVQNLFALLANKHLAGKAILGHWKDAVSERHYKQWLTQLHNNHELWNLIEKSGLDVTDPKSLRQSGREDVFSYNLLDKDVKIKGKKYNVGKYTLRPFERAFTSLGNRLRVYAFAEMAKKFQAEGKTFENSEKLYKDLANYLNNSTGRGKLHPGLQGADGLMSSVFWSPRLMASTFNLLGFGDVTSRRGFYRDMSPEIRRLAAKDAAHFIGTGVAVLGILALLGWETDMNPISTTFGSVTTPDKKKSYNIFGRFAAPVRTFAQMATGKRSVQGLTESIPANKRFIDLPLHYLRGRTTPLFGSAWTLASGKDYMGQPASLKKEALSNITPLSVGAFIQAAEKEGLKSILSTDVPSVVGINVSYADNFDKKVPTTIKAGEREVELTESQQKEFQDKFDLKSELYLTNLINTPEYNSATDEEKISLRRMVNRAAMNEAENELRIKYPKELKETPQERAARLKENAEEKKLKQKIGIGKRQSTPSESGSEIGEQ